MIDNEAALYALLEHTEPDPAYTLTTDRKGRPNLLIRLNGEEWRLHSGYDAVKEGAAFAQEHYLLCDEIIVYGLGFGYHIAPLLERLVPGQRLCVFETNLPILKLALTYTDIGAVLADERLTLYAGPDMRSLRKRFFARLQTAGRSVVVWYTPTARTRPDDVQTLYADIQLCRLQGDPLERWDINKVRPWIRNLSPLEKPVRVAFFQSLYDCGREFAYFTDNLIAGFRWLGCEVDILSEQTVNAAVANPIGLPWDFFVTYHVGELSLKSGDQSFYDAADIPVIAIQLDRPYHIHTERIDWIRNVICTWVARDDLRYAKPFYFPNGRHVFLAHGADMFVDMENALREDRPVDVLLVCNALEDRILDDYMQNVLPETSGLITEIAAYYTSHMEKSLEDCLIDWFAENGAACDTDLLSSMLHRVGFPIDVYRRGLKKRRVIEALLNAGIEVHCIGEGWDRTELFGHPLFITHGRRDFYTCREWIGHAKILVNIMPRYMAGSHERIFDAMMHGALCMTEGGNEYLSGLFTDRTDIAYYDYDNLNGLADTIRYYLANEQERRAITASAFEKTRSGHTWAHRAKELVGIYRDWAEAHRQGI